MSKKKATGGCQLSVEKDLPNKMNFCIDERDYGATMKTEEQRIASVVPFKMNFYIERDSFNTEPENSETKSDAKNMKNEYQKTESNSLIKRNCNVENHPIKTKAENSENSVSTFKSATSISSFTSYIKDINSDKKKSVPDHATKKLNSYCSSSLNKPKSLIGKYNKRFINFVKSTEVVETYSTQIKAKTENLLDAAKDCSGSSDEILQPVKHSNKNDDQKVDLAHQALDKKKRKKTEIPSLIQKSCETCKCTRECRSREKKCIQCNESMKYQCKQCNKYYETYKNAYMHVKIHCINNISLLKCSECDYTINKKYLLEIHTRQMHTVTKCIECGTTFENNAFLRRHELLECEKLKFYSIIEYYCFTCEKVLPKGEKSECSVCKKAPRIRCIKCLTICETDKYAYRHIKRCYNKIELHCNDCNYTTHLKSVLRIHINNKHTLKPRVCKKCGEKCNNSAALKLHIKTNHRNRKNDTLQLYCQKCEKLFNSTSIKKLSCSECLVELLYKCINCSSIFSDYFSGQRHVQNHCNNNSSFKCKICKHMILRIEMNKHMRYVHNDKSSTHKCTLCNFSSNLGGVRVHIGKMHQGYNESIIDMINDDVPLAQRFNIQSEFSIINKNHQNICVEKENALNVHCNGSQSGISNGYENSLHTHMENENALNAQHYNAQSEVSSSSENHLNADIKEVDTPNVQRYNIYNGFNSSYENSLNVHMEKENDFIIQQNHQNIHIDKENDPNRKPYNVQSHGNVNIKKTDDPNVQRYFIANEFNNSNRNQLNIQAEKENFLNVQRYDVHARYHDSYEISNEKENVCNVQRCDIKSGTKNNFENSSLFNFPPTQTEYLERFTNLNDTRHFCADCGVKVDNYQLMEIHRLYECPRIQRLRQINETTPSINVHCSNCNTSFKYFSGSLSHACLRCYNGLQFACENCKSIHVSLSDAKKHIEQGICFKYSVLPYSQFQNHNQFYATNVNAHINYAQMHHHYVTYK